MFMFVKADENKEWFSEEPKTKKLLLQGYLEAIPDVLTDISHDPRVMKNDHILNLNFRSSPVYFSGLYVKPDGLCVLSCIYVFPEHRKKGVGSAFLTMMQTQFDYSRAFAIQVAIFADKKEKLHKFYSSHGFKTNGQAKKDIYGSSFIDYFWSPSPFKLIETPTGTIIDPRK